MTRSRRRGAAACEVWWATPSDDPALIALLDDAERHRARRLRRAGDRDRFVTARALLRLVLAGRTGTAPSALHLDTTCHRCGADHGKPRLVGHRGAISFSIAHSGDRVVVGVTDGAAIGVDVEALWERSDEELAVFSTCILAPAELVDYWRIDPAERGRALTVWWTRKEAVLKATGHGLTVPMHGVTVTAPDQPAALRNAAGLGLRTSPMASLQGLTAGAGAVAYVAVLDVPALTVTERDGNELLSRTAPAGLPAAVTLS